MNDAYGKWLPVDISTHGYKIDTLIFLVHLFMLVLFVGWGIYFVYVLFKFRKREGHKADYQPIKGQYSKYAEFVIVIIEIVLLFGVSMPIWANFKSMPAKTDENVEIRCIAQQFAWNFHYAGKDGIYGETKLELVDEASNPLGLDPDDPGAKDDIVTLNNVYLPIDKNVIVHIRSKDVIHSFDIPVLRVKQDAIPGMEVSVWFRATKTGKFEIACAQLCGLGHYKMKGEIYLQTAEEHEKWLKEQTGGGAEEFSDTAPAAAPADEFDNGAAAPKPGAPAPSSSSADALSQKTADEANPNKPAAAPAAPVAVGELRYDDGFSNH